MESFVSCIEIVFWRYISLQHYEIQELIRKVKRKASQNVKMVLPNMNNGRIGHISNTNRVIDHHIHNTKPYKIEHVKETYNTINSVE